MLKEREKNPEAQLRIKQQIVDNFEYYMHLIIQGINLYCKIVIYDGAGSEVHIWSNANETINSMFLLDRIEDEMGTVKKMLLKLPLTLLEKSKIECFPIIDDINNSNRLLIDFTDITIHNSDIRYRLSNNKRVYFYDKHDKVFEYDTVKINTISDKEWFDCEKIFVTALRYILNEPDYKNYRYKLEIEDSDFVIGQTIIEYNSNNKSHNEEFKRFSELFRKMNKIKFVNVVRVKDDKRIFFSSLDNILEHYKDGEIIDVE